VKKSLLIPLLVLIAALALAACGGGGSSSSGGSDEGAIESAIETAATSTDPSKCTEVQTQKFNEAETSASGKQAQKVCEEQAEADESPAESVTVSEIKVNGKTATAEVEIGGGSLNDQGIELELVEEEGAWKLNKFVSFTNYDGKALSESLEEKLGEEEGIDSTLAKCIAAGVAELSQPEAEALAFEKNLEPIEELLGNCQ
jgi:hypothetical protein